MKTAEFRVSKRSQAVRFPNALIRKDGDDTISSPRAADWFKYLTSGPLASPSFMEDVDDLAVQQRRGKWRGT